MTPKGELSLQRSNLAGNAEKKPKALRAEATALKKKTRDRSLEETERKKVTFS